MRARRTLFAITLAAALLLPALASAQTAAPLAPPAASQGLPPLKPEHILAGVVGLLAGDTILHGVLGLPNALSVIAGGVAGYYIYIKYIEPEIDSGTRRIHAAAQEARVELAGLQARAGQGADDAYRWLGERLAPIF